MDVHKRSLIGVSSHAAEYLLQFARLQVFSYLYTAIRWHNSAPACNKLPFLGSSATL